eukprot:1179241-Prorocentrum_minimum.AAC.3
MLGLQLPASFRLKHASLLTVQTTTVRCRPSTWVTAHGQPDPLKPYNGSIGNKELRVGGGQRAVVLQQLEKLPADGPKGSASLCGLQPPLDRLEEPMREPDRRVPLPLDQIQLLQVVALQHFNGELGGFLQHAVAQVHFEQRGGVAPGGVALLAREAPHQPGGEARARRKRHRRLRHHRLQTKAVVLLCVLVKVVGATSSSSDGRKSPHCNGPSGPTSPAPSCASNAEGPASGADPSPRARLASWSLRQQCVIVLKVARRSAWWRRAAAVASAGSYIRRSTSCTTRLSIVAAGVNPRCATSSLAACRRQQRRRLATVTVNSSASAPPASAPTVRGSPGGRSTHANAGSTSESAASAAW